MAAKKSAKKKTSAKKTSAKKTSAKKTSAKKTSAKKTSAKKKASAKKPAAKASAKKASAPARTEKSTAKVRVADLAKAAKIGPKKTTTLVQHVFLQATPEQVFDAWVNPALTSTIIGGECTGDPKVGAPFTAWNGYILGKHVELVRGERVVQEWKTTEWPKGADVSRVELQLTPTGGGTEITLTHSTVPSEQAENYRQGWIDYYWTPMRAHFGG